MALPDTHKLASITSRSTGISNANVTSGAEVAGSVIDNATNLDSFLDVEIIWSYATAPTANKTVEIRMLYSLDGTNYEESWRVIGAVSPPADTVSHRRLVVTGLLLEPLPFKLAVKNVDTAQTVTVTLNAVTYNMQTIE